MRTMPSRLVIGLVGRKGSGKGTVAKLIKEKYGGSIYRFSDVLRDSLDVLAIEKSRENLILFSEIIRHQFGEDVIKRALLKRIGDDPSSLILLDGIRRLDELEGLEELGKFVLLHVDAASEIRYRRLSQRGENAGETTRTFESFMHLENASTEISMAAVEAKAQTVIDNSGDQNDLKQRIEQMMDSLLSPDSSSSAPSV